MFILPKGSILYPLHWHWRSNTNTGSCYKVWSWEQQWLPLLAQKYFEKNLSAAFEDGQSAKVTKVTHMYKPKMEPFFFDSSLMVWTEKTYDKQNLNIFLLTIEEITKQKKRYIISNLKDYRIDLNRSDAFLYSSSQLNYNRIG